MLKDKAATALLCANDTLALGAMAACEAWSRVGVPGGGAVIGYGNTEPGRYADPPLTTIDYDIEDNGRHLGKMLLQLLAGIPARALHQLESVHLLARQSDHAL